MTQNYRPAILLLISAGCLIIAGSGQAQTFVPVGPVSLEQSETTQRHIGPVYMLSLVEIADAEPAASVWFLQKEVVQENEPIEVHETAYNSLSAPSLRDFVSHLPKNAQIDCTNRYIPGPDSAARVSINQAAGLQGFAAFCRSKSVRFDFGIPF